MPDDKQIKEDKKKKCSALIPQSLLTAIEDKGRWNQTEAIIKGLECLLLEDREKITEDTGEDEQKIREEYERIIEEKDKHIETLKSEITQATKDKEYLQETHKNYMIQVQTQINTRLISEDKKPWWKIW